MHRRILIVVCLGYLLGCGNNEVPRSRSNSANSESERHSPAAIDDWSSIPDLSNVKLTPEIKKRLAERDTVHDLTLAAGFESADLPWLAELHGVRRLRLIETNLANANFQAFAALEEMDNLSLYGCRFRDADFATFPRLEKLATLQLTGAAITDGCADQLAELRLPELRSLSLENTSVTDAGVRRLCGVYNLEVLNLYLSEKNSEKSVPDIGRMNRLRLLGIGGTGLAPRFYPTAGVKELQRLLPKCTVDCGD